MDTVAARLRPPMDTVAVRLQPPMDTVAARLQPPMAGPLLVHSSRWHAGDLRAASDRTPASGVQQPMARQQPV
ncbi:hypothetical protein [Streptomyces sp. NPDC020362]|uniref:hypothetical protein n=1 Tax=unclassified Streptomyces TaxID=2593676 RepID=UPI0033EFD3B6